MIPDDPPALPAHPATHRRATLAALLGLAALGGPALAQTGGSRGMRQQQEPRIERDDKGEVKNPSRDVISAFARRLREGVPDLAPTPSQQPFFREFVARLAEVGGHNERRMQRIFWRSAGSFSAVAPLKSYLVAELDEGQGRQEALVELKAAFDRLDALLDDRQRGVLTGVFAAARSEVQAPRER